MDLLRVKTSGGVFGFVGAVHADPRRPGLLAVNGSFPPKGYLHDLIEAFPGANVLVAYLPGMQTPWTPATPEQLTAGLSEAAGRLLGDAPLVVFGSSTGNLLALGLETPNIVRRVAMEPFLQTELLWPFIDYARDRIASAPDPALEDYLWTLFGIGRDRVENRDYRPLLGRLATPTDVVVGGAPLLPRRTMDGWPSLVSAADRELFKAHPLVTLYEGGPETGHLVGPAGETLIRRLLHGALLEAARRF